MPPTTGGGGGGGDPLSPASSGTAAAAAAAEGDLLGLADESGPGPVVVSVRQPIATVRPRRSVPLIAPVDVSNPTAPQPVTPAASSTPATATEGQATGWLEAADGFEDWSTPTAASASRATSTDAAAPAPVPAPVSTKPTVKIEPPLDPASVFDATEGVLVASPAVALPGHGALPAGRPTPGVGGGGGGYGAMPGVGQVLYPPPVPNVVPDPRFYTPRSVVPATHVLSPHGVPVPSGGVVPPRPPPSQLRRPPSDPFAGL